MPGTIKYSNKHTWTQEALIGEESAILRPRERKKHGANGSLEDLQSCFLCKGCINA